MRCRILLLLLLTLTSCKGQTLINEPVPEKEKEELQEQTTPQEPDNQDPENQNPENQDPGNEDPGNEDPGNEDPGNEDPGNQDPGNQDPGNQDPGNEDPGNEDPGNEDPGNEDPGNEDPGNQDPGNEDPGNEDPGNQDPNPEGYLPVSLKSAVTNTQPMTGIVVWESDDRGTKKPWVTLEFAYMLYNDVCKQEGVFDWSPMERLLESVASRGHQAVVRFRYTYVGKSCAVPDYIKERDDYEATWGKSEGRNTEFPDWRCEELQRFHKEFHRRFAERYDTDPRLAFLETGFGLWAEYHIYDGPFIMGRTFPSKEFQGEFMREMDGWFHHTPWMISIDAADNTYGPFHKEPDLLNLNFGNFDDSFMCEDHDGYNTRSWKFFGTERYKRAPFGGEFSYYSNYDQKHCLDKEGMYGRTFESEVAKFHMTFIIGADQPGKQTDDRIKEAAMSMGYRFRVTAFSVMPGTGARIRIANKGVAPFYRDAYVAVDGVRADFNLRSLMPGDEAEIELSLPSASRQSVLTLESDALLPGQTLPFDANL